MIILYEVIHSVGEEEEKVYINSAGDIEEEAERLLVEYYTNELRLENANHYKLAENPEFAFTPGPTQLTKIDGQWQETG